MSVQPARHWRYKFSSASGRETVGDCIHAQAQSADHKTRQERSRDRNLRILPSPVSGGASAGWTAGPGAGCDPAAVQCAQVRAWGWRPGWVKELVRFETESNWMRGHYQGGSVIQIELHPWHRARAGIGSLIGYGCSLFWRIREDVGVRVKNHLRFCSGG